jgi:hypothetical protein
MDPDPGGPRTYGSGNRALHFRQLKMKIKTTRNTIDFANAYQDRRKYHLTGLTKFSLLVY